MSTLRQQSSARGNPMRMSGGVTVSCELCKKEYIAKTGAGLHVCETCMVNPPKPKEKKPAAGPMVCGREFGTKSIKIHQEQCLKKRAIEQSRLPPELRTALPPPPKLGDIPLSREDARAQYNEQAYRAAQSAMASCQNCGRKFLPDRLAVHLRSCRPGNAAKPVGKAAASPSRPTTVQQSSPSSALPSARASPPSPSSKSLSPQSSLDYPSASPIRPSIPKKVTVQPQPEVRVYTNGGMDEDGEESEDSQEEITIKSNGGYDLSGMGEEVGDGDEDSGDRVPCGNCGRSFNADRIAKHEAACSHTKDRKVFNSAANRLRGTGANAVKKSTPSAASPAKDEKKAKWKAEHEALVAAMKMGRQIKKIQDEGGSLADLPQPEPDLNPDYITCPHCARRFNETAAKRHIAVCANNFHKPKPPPALRAPSTPNPARATLSRLQTPSSPTHSPPSQLSPTKYNTLSPSSPTHLSPTPSKTNNFSLSPSVSRPTTTTAKRSPSPTKLRVPTAQPGAKPFCGGCGQKFGPADRNFCGYCGAKK